MNKPAWFPKALLPSLPMAAGILAVVLGARLLGANADEPAPLVFVHAAPITQEGAARGLNSMRLVQAPIIDGHLAEWPGIPSIELNRNTAYLFQGRISSPEDLSALIRSGWDDSYVYFAIEVTDDIVIGNDSTDVWRDDGVELGFDGLHDQYAWGWDDHQYTIVVDGRVTDRGTPATGLQVGIQQVPAGYTMEVAVPVTALSPGVPVSGTVMGFTVGLHDDDDGGNWDAYLIWEGTNTSSSPELFGTLTFTERPEDHIIALEARLIKLERRFQELLAILKQYELIAPLE